MTRNSPFDFRYIVDMKHIKEFAQLFENTQVLTLEQKDWLDKCTGTDWSVNSQTGLIDVDRSFDCSEQELRDFKGVRFGHVGGIFDCSKNELKSLEGAPHSVGGYFDCSRNKLKSLEGSPHSVEGDFDCGYNQLISLEGAPQEVGGSFLCHKNQLTSLEGAPQELGGGFDCINNSLISLKGAPQKVGGEFYFFKNPISNEIVIRVLRKMSDDGITLEQAVSDLWNDILEEDKPYLAKHNPDLSPDDKREYAALGRHKKRLI